MEYRTRDGQTVRANDGQDRLLAVMYRTPAGRGLLRLLVQPWVSKLGGRLLSTKLSCGLIGGFVRRNHIDLSQYERKDYKSYNDFFTRRIRDGMRPWDMDPSHLASPCDGKLTVCPVTADGKLEVKGASYTAASLLRDAGLAERYYGGFVLVFRLTVDDYHRFFYIDDGLRSGNRTVTGVFHTVNPVAGERVSVYKENHREYSLLKSEHFGTVLMMEVGALLVGRIVNRHGRQRVRRGMEKGYFEFGGSTVVLIFEKGRIEVDGDIRRNSKEGIETIVRAGERIGISL